MSTGTLVDVVMPQMGVSVSEGTVVAWRKQVGETVKADETIVEISTDKVDTEVPSPAAGTVREILVPEGETVDVGTQHRRDRHRRRWRGGPRSAGRTRGRGSRTRRRGRSSRRSRSGGRAAAAPPTHPTSHLPPPRMPRTSRPCPSSARPRASSAADEADANGESRDLRSFMSPVVARMVAEHGLDIAKIPGTGRGGRVTKKDVEQFLGGGAPAPKRRPQPPPAAAAPAPAPAVQAPTGSTPTAPRAPVDRRRGRGGDVPDPQGHRAQPARSRSTRPCTSPRSSRST